MDQNQTIAMLQGWLRDKIGRDVDPGEIYLGDGLLDSFEVLGLILFVEQTFHITLTADDLQHHDFTTLKGLAGLIGRRVTGG